MKVFATLAALLLATTVSAVTVTTTNIGTTPVGQSVLYDFETGTPKGLTGNFSIVKGSVDGQYAAPLNDSTNYLAVPTEGTSGSATLVLANALSNISFDWGSIDAYNTVSFFGANKQNLGSVTGSQVPGVSADGNQFTSTNNRNVSFSFGNDRVKSIVFTSTNKAFEVDNIAGAVPEPATWALMLIGFGFVGAAARRNTTRVVAA